MDRGIFLRGGKHGGFRDQRRGGTHAGNFQKVAPRHSLAGSFFGFTFWGFTNRQIVHNASHEIAEWRVPIRN
jgi:hypothetical protein